MLTFQGFKTKVSTSPPIDHVRQGQHAFNMLCRDRPEMANRIRGRYGLDPFYNDDNLPAFWDAVEKLWS